ncbi:MAG: hypothetical protein ACRDAW_02990 [Metamycoplasmataceae bacterium]
MKKKIKFLLIPFAIILPSFIFVSCAAETPKETKDITSVELDNFINWDKMLQNFSFKTDVTPPSTTLYDLQSIKKFQGSFTFEKYKDPQPKNSSTLNVLVPFFNSLGTDIVNDVVINNVTNDENFASFIFDVKLNNAFLYKYTGKNNFYSTNKNFSISIANNNINSLLIKYGVNVRIGNNFTIEKTEIENGILQNSNLSYNNQNPPISVGDFILNPQVNFEKYIYQSIPIERNGWTIDFANSVFEQSKQNKNVLVMKLVLTNPTIYPNPGESIIKENIRISGFKLQ